MTTTDVVARDDRVRRLRRLGYALLALLAYVPVLLTKPGKVVADTKSYLYLDPGRLLERAASMWDPHIGMGTVTHQNIGYLFPMGPYYWVLHLAGVPAWVSQRLWLGSILFGAALGVLFLLRTLHMRGPGAVVATIVVGAGGAVGVGVVVVVLTVPLCSVSGHRYTCELVIKSNASL